MVKARGGGGCFELREECEGTWAVSLRGMESDSHSLLLAAIHQRVEIEPYDSAWMIKFADERGRLMGLFPGVFKGIEHFGSTAVAGLGAKPLIDILAGVESMEIADGLLGPLCEAGYDTSKEFNATLTDRRWLMLHAKGKRTHHLHLVIYGEANWRRSLAFRDALRGDRELAMRYEKVKRELAILYGDDREAYTAAKGVFIESVIGE